MPPRLGNVLPEHVSEPTDFAAISHTGTMDHYISPFVKHRWPDASERELHAATEALLGYLRVWLRIRQRLALQSHDVRRRDKNAKGAMVYTNKNRGI